MHGTASVQPGVAFVQQRDHPVEQEVGHGTLAHERQVVPGAVGAEDDDGCLGAAVIGGSMLMFEPKPNVATHTHAMAVAGVGAPTTINPALIIRPPHTITLLRANADPKPRASNQSEAMPPATLPKSTVR